jgi:hypothetical protein
MAFLLVPRDNTIKFWNSQRIVFFLEKRYKYIGEGYKDGEKLGLKRRCT